MEVTQSILIDVRDICESIEGFCARYLLPDEDGWYLPFSRSPAIRRGEHGCVMYHNDSAIPFTTPEAIVADVVNKYGQVVVPFRLARQLTETPRYSPRTLKLIRACVEHLLNRHARWKQARVPSVDAEVRDIKIANARDLYRDRMRDLRRVALTRAEVRYQQRVADRDLQNAIAQANQLQDRPPEVSSAHDLTGVIQQFVFHEYAGKPEILEAIEDHLLRLVRDVVDFLGEDQWVMHFQKIKHGTLTIEKTGDYRVLEWHRMTGTPW